MRRPEPTRHGAGAGRPEASGGPFHSFRLWSAAAALAALWMVLQGGSCRKEPSLPSPSSKEYGSAVRTFFVGLAALQAGDTDRALKQLTDFTRLAPGEPAGWADLAVLELRSQRSEDADRHLRRARDIAPSDSRIVYLHALAKGQRGDFAGAAADFRKVIELDPRNLRARYALVEQVEQNGGAEAASEARRLLQGIARERPGNMVVLLDLARLAAKQGDVPALRDAVAAIGRAAPAWPAGAGERYSALRSAAAAGSARAAVVPVLYLKNLMQESPKYRADLAALRSPTGQLGDPIERLIRLPNPPSSIADPDDALAFTPAPQATSGSARYAAPIYLSADARPIPVTVTDRGVEFRGLKAPLPYPGGPGRGVLGGHPVVAADLNNDFRMDLACAGAGGLRIYMQAPDGHFVDATAKSRLPASVTTGSLRGIWAADVDMDGDLDLVVALTRGAPMMLRNNTDGTYTPAEPFRGATDVVDFGWGDLDNDGDPDAVMLSANGDLQVFTNERSGRFTRISLMSELGPVAAFAILDSRDTSQLDIAVLKQDGRLVRAWHDAAGEEWRSEAIGLWAGASGLKPGSTRLLAADLDNNGGVDLIASNATETRVWLHGPGAVFRPLASPIAASVLAAADVEGNGRPDLIGLSADGKPVVLSGRGAKSYAWDDIRPQAVHARGDQRINSFGIGGDIEVRAGFLVERVPIAAPVVHFGLGANPGVDAARIFWPNGQMQAEFALKPGQTVVSVQRLKGSCPWVFAWDGTRMAFVTDFLWRSPLGLRINSQDTGRVMMTEEWALIRGSTLAPRNGAYDIRITAELWETHYFDLVALMTVDHPAGTEVWVDEKFAMPPPKLEVIETGPIHPIERATDDHGTDVTPVVRDLDGRYLDTFGRGDYQGVAPDHYMEVDLGTAVPDSGPLWLIGQGWTHPTDSSVNVAISQGNHAKPRDLSLEIPDGKGGWQVARPHIGFPAGKTKTILIDLTGIFRPGQPKRMRLRTNMEIYWDRLAWATGPGSRQLKTQRSPASAAELRYRGFSAVHTADASSPELPDYADLAGTTQRWCDLVGYYTRFGDVRELLRSVDDRYVIMNAGDEMMLRFPVLAPPPSGWVRDFVLIGDGWEKDGDLNTGFSKTVLPLPSHADPYYRTPPSTLQNDPVYRRYPRDWQVYQTRYVTPEAYWSAFRTGVSP